MYAAWRRPVPSPRRTEAGRVLSDTQQAGAGALAGGGWAAQAGTVQVEVADAAGKPLADHVTHLVIHALLHLLGYDHIREADATLMEGIEVRALARLGLSDPYL